MTKNHFSTPKIIIYICIFIALMLTALFMVRFNQQPYQPPIPEEEGTVFSAPRDIKAFELVTENNQPFTQNNFLQHWTLLFFGFTHCTSICPTTLALLNGVYQELHPDFPSLQVVLISVDPERDTADIVTHYAHSFNPKFIGVTGKKNALRKLQSQLGIFSAVDSTTVTNYQMQHTPSILLITPQGKWAGLFHNNLSKDQLINAFRNTINSYSR